MAVDLMRPLAPLLGNYQPAAGQSSSGVARTARGVSDPAQDLLGLGRRAAVPLSLVEFSSPSSAELSRALTGFFQRTQTVRDAAGRLASLVAQESADNQFDAEQIISRAADLVGAINDLREFVSDNPGTLEAGLLTRVDTATDSLELKTSLANIGITFDSSGEVTLDESLLRQSVADQSQLVASTLALASGLATRELDLAGSLLNSATAAVIGFGGAAGATSSGSFLLAGATRDQAEFVGRFVNLRA